MNAGDQSVGEYEILAPLGQGGMARTYLAVRRGPGGFEQRVCLKRILTEHQRDPEFTRQFLAEAQIAASVSHANLVKVLNFGQDAEGYVLALELVEGRDLSALLSKLKARGDKLPLDLATHIAIELATALEVLHRASPDGAHAGLIHRDVSPSNVLISYDGEVKLADFGISRPIDGPQHTRTGIIKGKVPYMAPSYARTARPNVQCDLFATGVVLFEALSGQRPYQGATDLLTLELAAKGEHAPLASLAPDAPKQLVGLVERLIDPDPNFGVQSANELLTELSAIPLSAATARRQLGQLVESLYPVQDSVFRRRSVSERPPAFASSEAFDSTPAAAMALAGPDDATLRGVGYPPAPAQQDASPTRANPTRAPRVSARTVTLAAAVLALAAVAAAWLVTAPPRPPSAPATNASPSVLVDTVHASPPQGERNAPTTSAVVRGVGEPAAAVPTDDSPAEAVHDVAAPAADNDEAQRKATLHISVIPYGDVLIDGRPRGRAPVTTRVGPGTHEITVMRQGTRTTRRVTLAAGESRRVLVQ